MSLMEIGWTLLRSLPPLTAWRILHSTPTWFLDWIAEREGRGPEEPGLETEIFGIKLRNPVGTAAGFDKDGRLIKIAWSMGVGFHVVGSVLPQPHKGVKPKILVRLPDGSTINRLGLPSKGIKKTLEILKGRIPKELPIVISIASLTPQGYGKVYKAFTDIASWFELNISCPNVREHSTFEDPDAIKEICRYLRPLVKPVLLKIPPILNRDRLLQYIDITRSCGFRGLVIANTKKISYKGIEAGLGGPRLYPIIKKIVSFVREMSPSDFVIVAVGGIDSGEKALEIMEEGANLIEVFSAIIHKGPGIIDAIKSEMLRYTYKEIF
jgi:dihydroorotate dehydrogenase